MVDIWPLVQRRAPFADGGEGAAYRIAFAVAAHSFKAFANRMNHGGRHGFTGLASQLLGKFVSFGVFDVETHWSTILDFRLPVYPYS